MNTSRAHTIVAIQFVQKTKDERGKGLQKTSIINLVDLAGRYHTKMVFTNRN